MSERVENSRRLSEVRIFYAFSPRWFERNRSQRSILNKQSNSRRCSEVFPLFDTKYSDDYPISLRFISMSSPCHKKHGKKKVALNLKKTRCEFTQNVAFAYIYQCSPVGKSKVFQLFCSRWIRVFVPLSGIFRNFPKNTGNFPVFSGIFLEFTSPLTLGECLVCLCSQMFSRCKTSRSPALYNWKLAFSLVFQSGKCR